MQTGKSGIEEKKVGEDVLHKLHIYLTLFLNGLSLNKEFMIKLLSFMIYYIID